VKIAAVCGGSTGAPVCSTPQSPQQLVPASSAPDWSSWLVPAAALPWQITAALRGSEAAMLAAQQATIGAQTWSASANRTMGRKFFSRLRIATSIRGQNNHQQSPKSRRRSRNYLTCRDQIPNAATRYCRSARSGGNFWRCVPIPLLRHEFLDHIL